MREYKTVDEIHQLTGTEQLLNSLTSEKRLWILERKPKVCVKAGEMLDAMSKPARLQEGGPVKPRQEAKASEAVPEGGKVPRDTPVQRKSEQRSSGRDPKCFLCHQFGHFSNKCPS